MPKIRALWFVLIMLFGAATSFAQIEDGFGPAKSLKAAHFTVFYSPDLDTFILANDLNISLTESILAGDRGLGNAEQDQDSLSSTLDTLFDRVSDILDMHLYSFHGTIKICRDASQLELLFSNLYDTSLAGKYSFYSFDINTIYISPEHFTKEVLGHEIAHAIISHYFVVQPPVKVAEILAGYVEYQLRKP